MKRPWRTVLPLVILLALVSFASGQTFEAIPLLNQANLAKKINDHLGFLYDSHGCLHFTPANIYLLYRTIPQGIPLTIKSYADRQPPAGQVAHFDEVVTSEADIEQLAAVFKSWPTRLLVYPGLERLYVIVDGQPYLQMRTRPGPARDYRQAFQVTKNGPIDWDRYINTPTDAGNYMVLRAIRHYLSNAYRQTTIVPFGAWLELVKGKWVFQDGQKWYQAPAFIAADLALPYGRNDFEYYDVHLDARGRITAARWAGNDFGLYALLWTADGKTAYPELGYAEGALVFEQVTLVNDLAYLLTTPEADDLDACIAGSENWRLYRDSYNFVRSSGEAVSPAFDPNACSYYKLFNGLKLTAADKANIDGRLRQAYADVKGNKVSPQTLGLYYYLRDYDATFRKQAGWYQLVKDDWAFWSTLRRGLRKDFELLGIEGNDKRLLTARQWLERRLNFQTVYPPAGR